MARVGKYYNYTLPSNTFSNYAADVTYKLIGNPTWLSIDSNHRQLSGTPNASDAGNISFQLSASDASGTAFDNIVLVVSANSEPYIAESLTSQLAKIGQVDGQGGLVLKPNTPFQITFSQHTFAETGGNVSAYYGTSDNYTPLPSWIYFDPTNIQFTGTTLPVVSSIAPPQYFEFVLVGTDYPGFAGVSATFQIVVGTHQLAFSTLQYFTNASESSSFSFTVPIQDLILDGQQISSSNITSLSANTSSTWLHFDASQKTLSGTSPATPSNTTIAITALDIFGDVATTEVIIATGPDLENGSARNITIISASLPLTFNLTAGSFFNYTFGPTVVPSSATLNISIADAPWLHYNPENRTIYGNVPSSALLSMLHKRQVLSTPSVTVTATQGGQSQSQTVGIDITSSSVSPTVTTSMPSTSSPSATAVAARGSATTTATKPTNETTSRGLNYRQKLGLGLGLGLPLFLGFVALLVGCCYRRKSRKHTEAKSAPDISRPVSHEKDDWPQNSAISNVYDEPRQIGAFEMFKSSSDGRLSGYAVEVNNSGILAPPILPTAHELPPLPESPGFDAVRSAYGSSEHRNLSTVNIAQHSQVPVDGVLSKDTVSTGPQQNATMNTIKPVINPRRSILQSDFSNRESVNTMDTISTDELFSVRLIGDNSQGRHQNLLAANAEAKSRDGRTYGYLPPLLPNSQTQNSAQTIGTYTSSEGEYIRRYGSQGESLSSGEPSNSISQRSGIGSNQPQPWRIINSQDSYESFGSYATTDSNLSGEFSFDESLSGSSDQPAQHDTIVEESDGGSSNPRDSSKSTSRPTSEPYLLEAPISPDWATTPIQSAVQRRPTLNERVASMGKGKLVDYTAAKRPMSKNSVSISSPDRSADTTGSSAEIAFV